MNPIDRALFLSLKPTFADLILDGHKTVELRRIRPRGAVGTLVVVYASSPVCAVVGTCLVENVGTGTPDAIWKLHGPRTHVRRTEYRRYFDGSSVAVAITVGAPRRLDRPVDLTEIRGRLAGFAPPQSFRYITPPMAEALLGRRWREHTGRSTLMTTAPKPR